MTLLPAITAALYFTLYPAICLAHCMVAALQLFLSPFVDLALLVLHTALLPWRILAKFQVNRNHIHYVFLQVINI